MTFGLPRELPPLISLAVGAALLAVPQLRARLSRGSLTSFVAVAAGLAALLSGAYVALYLRGGPRIIDATTYFLQGRAMSEGLLSWPDQEPSQSFVGRFLVRDTLGGGDHVAGIFPPGYPLLLALGFLLGAPMIVGPLLAIAATYATSFVTDAALPDELPACERDATIRLAVALSVVCAALRYHTADTMSHGLAACLLATAVGAALRFGRRGALGDAAMLGASLGFLACTRPVSALALVPIAAVAAAPRVGAAAAGVSLASASPFIALFVAHQRAATGALGASSQALYYAQSDHPAGCFGYGFGPSIGCRFEHGDFVDRYLPSGYGLVEAVGTTARRVSLHAGDALNAAPLGVVLAVALVLAARRSRELRLTALAVPALVVAYAPFYFDGNVPGAGARFFADALPVEHALVAWLVVQRAAASKVRHGGPLAVGLALVGFALFTHVDHEQLRDREGGRPMFEPALLEAASVRGGLVLVDTDHAFALGFDPRSRAQRDSVEIARLRGDALDTFLWEARGRPATFAYRFDVATGEASLSPYVPPPATQLEGEHLWPALEQAGAAVAPIHTADPCVSRGRVLAISADGKGLSRLRLPAALAGQRLTPIVSIGAGDSATFTLKARGEVRASVQSGSASVERSCVRLGPLSSRQTDTSLELAIEVTLDRAGPRLIALDKLEIEGLAAAPEP
ncbi:MAG: hypothetical protein IPM79_30670 [Polyangiaceae bacterium]|nr:hypothetical protein [Polyangiaceae bacterium]MBK8941849.1 hypothetical protein [Polyangiaceae bacterium]